MKPQTLTASLLAVLAGPALAHWIPTQEPAPSEPRPAAAPRPEPAALPILGSLYPEATEPEPPTQLGDLPLLSSLFPDAQEPVAAPPREVLEERLDVRDQLRTLAFLYENHGTAEAPEPVATQDPSPAPRVPLLVDLPVVQVDPAALTTQVPRANLPAPQPQPRWWTATTTPSERVLWTAHPPQDPRATAPRLGAQPTAPAGGGVTVVVESGDVHIHTGPGAAPHVSFQGDVQVWTSSGVGESPGGWMVRDGQPPVPTPPVTLPPAGRMRVGAEHLEYRWRPAPPMPTGVNTPDSASGLWVFEAQEGVAPEYWSTTVRPEGQEGSAEYLYWSTSPGTGTDSSNPLFLGTVQDTKGQPLSGAWITTLPTPQVDGWTPPWGAQTGAAPTPSQGWFVDPRGVAPEAGPGGDEAQRVLRELEALIDDLGNEVQSLREELRVLHEEVRQAPRRGR